VSDRRRFSSEGEPLEGEESSTKEPPAGATAEKAASTETPPKDEQKEEAPPGATEIPQAPPMPEASFEMLVVSLAMQAQMELMPSQGEGAPAPNLDVARHTIDLLAILRDKTKGNLSFEESRLMDNTLTELRFRYVQRINEINEKAKG